VTVYHGQSRGCHIARQRNQLPIQRFEIHEACDLGAEAVLIPRNFLGRAKIICAEEIGLIDAEIAERNIPFPETIPRTRPIIQLSAKLLYCTNMVLPPGTSVAPALGDERAGIGTRNKRTHDWRRFGLWKLLFFLTRPRVSKLAGIILKNARPGPIVIVGEGMLALALAEDLRRKGRDSEVLSPGNGAGVIFSPGYLLRPAKDSLIGWVLENQRNLEYAGAVIFLGEDDLTFDIDALCAAHDKPPVLFASGKGRWRLEVISVHRDGLSRKELVEAGKGLPCISIVIVSFNQAAFLEAAIRSVIDQNYPNLDLIIVDGGSTDGSVEIIERYSAQFAHVVIEPDQGQSDALNKGFALATGEMLNWLCSDDMLEPEALHRIAEAYVSTHADLIVGGCMRIGETRSDELYRHHTALVIGRKVQFDAEDLLNYTRSWLKANYFFQPEVFFSRRIWHAAGGHIKRHLYYLIDYDLWFRMALAGASIYHVPAFLGCSRVHAAQKTTNLIEVHQARQIMAEYHDLFSALEVASELSEVRPA
jgi:GT2 family glycosyltransferase